MPIQRSTLFRLFALVAVVLTYLGSPRVVRADESGTCNTFCWYDCSSIQGSWCGTGCGVAITCQPAGVCSSVGLVTVNCFNAQ